MALDPLPQGAAKRGVVQSMFDRIAPRYDLLNRVISLGLDQGWRRRALEAAEIGPGARVLDLACGTGDLARLAAARGARVVGIDFAAAMLRRARERTAGVALVRGDAERLPLPDAWADAILCGFALRNFVSIERVLEEAARVLVAGGRLVLLEVGRPEGKLLRALHGLYFRRVVPRIGAWLSDASAYAYLPNSVAYLPPPSELARWLEKAGFEDVERHALALGSAELWRARRSGSSMR